MSYACITTLGLAQRTFEVGFEQRVDLSDTGRVGKQVQAKAEHTTMYEECDSLGSTRITI